jgi:hypothetical protein
MVATDGWKFRTPVELRRAIADESVIYREGIVKEKMCYNKGKSLSQKEGAGAVRFGGDLEFEAPTMVAATRSESGLVS